MRSRKVLRRPEVLVSVKCRLRWTHVTHSDEVYSCVVPCGKTNLACWEVEVKSCDKYGYDPVILHTLQERSRITRMILCARSSFLRLIPYVGVRAQCSSAVFEREAREYLFSRSLTQSSDSCHLYNTIVTDTTLEHRYKFTSHNLVRSAYRFARREIRTMCLVVQTNSRRGRGHVQFETQ